MAQSPWGKKTGSSGGGVRPSGGGSGNGGNDPSGAKPNGSFDPDALLRKFFETFEKFFGSTPGNDRNPVLFVLGALAVIWLASGIYRVNSDELGVVVRFGEYHRTTNPGLNYHLPYPIEQVIIPSVTSVNKVTVGDRNSVSENPTVRRAKMSLADSSSPQNREGQMLTGDRNIVDIGFEVQWKIDASAPEKYLFNLRDPEQSIHAVAESAMREVIGRNKLGDILTTAQSKIAEDTRQIMQQVFDSYGAGVEIIAVNLSRPDVPQPVIDEFQDVKRAEQDKQTAESVAEGYRNEIVPKAKGEAVQMMQQAEAYKAQVIANANGDASRFTQVYNEYKQAKDVTKKRIYLETMEEILKGMPKVITEKGSGASPTILPLMMQGKQVAPTPTPLPQGAP